MRKPPRRKPGQGKGPRSINGVALDVRKAAEFLGYTQKSLRTRIARRRIPFRRDGGRIVFLRRELEEWLERLPGVSFEELKREGER